MNITRTLTLAGVIAAMAIVPTTALCQAWRQ